MSKTNIELCEYAKAQLGKPYWYGTFGNTSTKNLYRTKKKQYPSQYTWSCPDNQLNKRVHDCVGLIKGYLWSKTFTSKPVYKASQDVSANGMYDVSKIKGSISSMPDIPGILVFMDGHVGVYIGNGYVIEARGHAYGVVKTKLRERNWKRWSKCPFLEYVETEKKNDNKSDNNNVKYYPKYKGRSISIVDALASLGIKNEYKCRTEIAQANGIKMYTGTPSQNLKMLKLLRNGKLIKP